MLVSKEYYFLNFLLVSLVFYLFVLLISIFGFIFYFIIKKHNDNDWELNTLEIFFISYAIGLTIYISICFILDIFQFFNFFTGYISIALIDALFIWYLIYHGDINREKISDFINSIKSKFIKKPKERVIFLVILFSLISLQFWIQWEIITKEYAISSKDTYVWLGQTIYLLKNGYLWRDHLTLHYPKGYTFYLTAPELIYPDYRFAYFYMKFAGIPFFSFYIIILAVIIKKNFKKNYMVFIGILLLIISNFIFTRFNSFVSSSICALLILISLIMLRSKCPMYFTGFICVSTFLFNSLLGLFFTLALIIVLFIRLISLDTKLINFLKTEVAKIFLIIIILMIPYVLHTFFVQNINFNDYITLFFNIFGISLVETPQDFKIVISNPLLLQIRYFLKDFYPDNEFVYVILDLERRILSYFIFFALISLFLPSKKFFKKKNRDLINFCKFSVLIIIAFYLIEIFFSEHPNEFSLNSIWFRARIIEALVGPIILLACFIIEMTLKKAKCITIYLSTHYKTYKNLIEKNGLSKFLKIENIMITIILISLLSTSVVNRRIYYTYYFEQDQIETIFYIKDYVPDDSKILVSDLGEKYNFFYNLLSTYKYYIWDFEFSENSFNETIDYMIKKDIKYILLDYTLINSTEKSYFTSYPDFEERYKNDYDIVFKVEI